VIEKVQTIIISDIFGKTQVLEGLTHLLCINSEIIDPYQGKSLVFTDENQAYQYFVENVGIEDYAKLIKDKLVSVKQPTKVIAFSVGASSVWQVSALIKNKNILDITCFYGSQIRHNVEVKPDIPMKLILPKYEEHFSINELAIKLRGKPNVMLEHCNYLHGFMNKLSVNFNEVGYCYYLKRLKES